MNKQEEERDVIEDDRNIKQSGNLENEPLAFVGAGALAELVVTVEPFDARSVFRIEHYLLDAVGLSNHGLIVESRKVGKNGDRKVSPNYKVRILTMHEA